MNAIRATKILLKYFQCKHRDLYGLSYGEIIQMAMMIEDSSIVDYPEIRPVSTYQAQQEIWPD